MDAAEAEELFAAADAAGRVLIEAYMTPFHRAPRRWSASSTTAALGDLRADARGVHVPARHERPDDHRLDPVLGGGASLDVGIYCTAPMLRAAGREPVAVAATAVWQAPGVDRTLSALPRLRRRPAPAASTSPSSCRCASGSSSPAPTRRSSPTGPSTRRWRRPPFDVVQRRRRPRSTSSFDGASAYLGMVDHVDAVVLDGASAPPRARRDPGGGPHDRSGEGRATS